MPESRPTQSTASTPSARPEGVLAPAARPVVTSVRADVSPFWFVSGTLLVLGTAALLLYTRTGER